MSNKIDLVGVKFGKLEHEVLSETNKREGGSIVYICRCGNCGKEMELSARRIKFFIPLSCGCLDNRSEGRTKHGFGKNTNKNIFYRHWSKMKSRCNSLEDSNIWYFDKNIKVCNEWHKFINFKNDMYEDYLKHVSLFGEENTTIDRIDSNLGYYKENCRWTTNSIQTYNRDYSKHSLCTPILAIRIKDGYKIITYNRMMFAKRIFNSENSNHIRDICLKNKKRNTEKGWTFEYITHDKAEKYILDGFDYINSLENFKLSIPYFKINTDLGNI